MKPSPYLNSDGSFKGGFDGCVLHMTEHEGHSEDSAKRICGSIAQDVNAKEVLAKLKPTAPQYDPVTELFCRLFPHAELECRMAVSAPATAAGEFMVMPGGTHTIYPSRGGKPVEVSVMIDPSSAAALNEQLKSICAKSPHLPFFDFNHDDSEASFWPTLFTWRDAPAPGVYASGEWSAKGKDAIEGKMYRAFSPVFHVDDVKGKPARVVANPNARLNFGGLVNSPAFRANLPIWAKQAGATQQT